MIRRTYECMDCHQWFEVDHDSGDEPEPPCPRCDVVLEWRPQSFNIGTVKGKAVDVAQKIFEEDFGITNMKDNVHEGETYAIEAPPTRAERDEKARVAEEVRAFAAQSAEQSDPKLAQTVKNFFGGGSITQSIDITQTLAASKRGPGAYTPDNNPMTMLHKSGKAGHLPNNMRIVARG